MRQGWSITVLCLYRIDTSLCVSQLSGRWVHRLTCSFTIFPTSNSGLSGQRTLREERQEGFALSMGGWVSKRHAKLSWGWHTRLGRKMRVVMLGLDNSGKTTILCRLAFGDTVKTLPTVGFNVETISYKKLNLVTWDVGGQKKLRQLWKHYLKDTHATIFVVDSSDVFRINEARQELKELMRRPEMAGGLLLVLANKQDMPLAMPPNELARMLRLKHVARKCKWHVEGTVGTTGNGIYEAIDWLATALHERSLEPPPSKRTTWRFVSDAHNKGKHSDCSHASDSTEGSADGSVVTRYLEE